MPAQILGPSQQPSADDSIQLLLMLKRQKLEQQLAEHKLNVEGPLNDELLRTNRDLLKQELASKIALAPSELQRSQAGASSAQTEAANLPSLLAQQSQLGQAKIAGEQTSQQATQQQMAQSAAMNPIALATAQEQQRNLQSEIAARQTTLDLAKREQTLREDTATQTHQADILHTFAAMTGNPTGFATMRGIAQTSKDPFMQQVARALPENYTPQNPHELAAIIGNQAMLSNDPVWAHVKQSFLDATGHVLDQPGAGKEQLFSSLLGTGSQSGNQSDAELTQSVSQLMSGAKQPSQAGATPTSQELAQSTVGPPAPGSSGTPTPSPATSKDEGMFGVSVAPRTENHIEQNRKIANRTISQESTGGEFGGGATGSSDEWRKFIMGIPVDPGSGLGLDSKAQDGSLVAKSNPKNPFYAGEDLQKFADASEPPSDATGAQVARFTSLLSDLAKIKDPDPKLLLGIISSGKFTKDQINSLLDLGRSVGWRMDGVDNVMKVVQAGGK